MSPSRNAMIPDWRARLARRIRLVENTMNAGIDSTIAMKKAIPPQSPSIARNAMTIAE